MIYIFASIFQFLCIIQTNNFLETFIFSGHDYEVEVDLEGMGGGGKIQLEV